MRIAFLVERPTQFEAPFYRHAARQGGGELVVLFTDPEPAAPALDPELGRAVDWGIDLLGGYPQAVLPRRGRAGWLREHLAAGGYDLLVTNGYTRRVYLLGAALARRAGVATGLRLDSVLWGESGARRRAKRLLLSGLLARAYDLFFGVGSRTLEYLRAHGVPPERTALFPYAVDVEHFRERSRRAAAERRAVRERLGVPLGARVVLSLAKFSSREAPWDLVRALSHPPCDGVTLVLAGDGPQRGELERAAAELAPGRVRFPGYVPYPELPALYAAADLFVHPAREERWGVSVQEALACGLPVVASSRVGAAHDLVLPGRNGALYAAGDAEELARRLGEALALPPAAVRAASDGVLARWDYAATWRGLLAAAERVAARRAA
ncbi:MAG TPA: glycosyltransferase, partial [Thermoanaerobaculia bacterium]|nr:glycosyltransferase [Thermoanaerobaculia bacterium]